MPDHRPGRIVLACSCGTVLELPPGAAEAARPRWDAIHQGEDHRPVNPEVALQAARSSTFEGFIAAAKRVGRA